MLPIFWKFPPKFKKEKHNESVLGVPKLAAAGSSGLFSKCRNHLPPQLNGHLALFPLHFNVLHWGGGGVVL